MADNDGVNIDNVHRNWPPQRGLFRKNRSLHGPCNWIMLAGFVGFLIAIYFGAL